MRVVATLGTRVAERAPVSVQVSSTPCKIHTHSVYYPGYICSRNRLSLSTYLPSHAQCSHVMFTVLRGYLYQPLMLTPSKQCKIYTHSISCHGTWVPQRASLFIQVFSVPCLGARVAESLWPYYMFALFSCCHVRDADPVSYTHLTLPTRR